MPSIYAIHCKFIVNWPTGHTWKWNRCQNTTIYIKKKTYLKLSSAKWRPIFLRSYVSLMWRHPDKKPFDHTKIRSEKSVVFPVLLFIFAMQMQDMVINTLHLIPQHKFIGTLSHNDIWSPSPTAVKECSNLICTCFVVYYLFLFFYNHWCMYVMH